jgi:signal recognition particle GTPase
VFANLTDKLTKALRDLRGLSKLSEENIAPALTEVRSALMSADVNFKVAKDFTERVKVACLGQAVIESVSAKANARSTPAARCACSSSASRAPARPPAPPSSPSTS